MHETEIVMATSVLTNPEPTESFVIGEADEDQIKQLRSVGLIVETLATLTPVETPGNLELREMGMLPSSVGTRGDIALGPRSFPLDEPFRDWNYYLVQLSGPLLESYRVQLEQMSVVPLEFIPTNTFTAKLMNDQLTAVSTLPFVQQVTLYDSQQTKAPATRSAPQMGSQSQQSGDVQGYDVRLHQHEDMGSLFDWLTAQNALIAGTGNQKIRLFAIKDSSLITDLAIRPEVAAIEEYVAPRLFNDVARRLLQVDRQPGAPPLLPLLPNLTQTGVGQIVGIADTGLDDAHPDFAGRIVGLVGLGRSGVTNDPNGHGTHVAGSVLGDGTASNGEIQGVAPGASLFFQSLLDNRGELGGLPINLEDLFEEAYLNGVRIHNNSWGADTQARYTFNSNEVDAFVARRRDMLLVVAAGNDGSESIAQPPLSPRVPTGFVDWLSVGSPASAKNALTVGASRSDRTTGGLSTLTYGSVWPNQFMALPVASEQVSGDPECMAGFSSRGPCDDRRIKPDLVAPGTDVLSAKSSRAPLRNFWGPSPNPQYAYMGGTSMASPLVAGCAALVRQYYQDNGHSPSAALLKATLINGTRSLSGPCASADNSGLPNYHQGFGAVSMAQTLPNQTQAFTLIFRDFWQPADVNQQFRQTGQRFRYTFDLTAPSWLHICLAYTDLPNRALQNNLNLFLQFDPTGNGTKWFGNQDARDVRSLGQPDGDNNVEVIKLPQAQTGRYLIQVQASNLLRGPQDYALVVSSPSLINLMQIP